MAAILATVDIEDLASPKVQNIRNALADLTAVIDSIGRTGQEVSRGLQSSADQLTAMAARTKAAAAGYKEIQDRIAGLAATLPQVTARTSEYLATLAVQEAQQRTITSIITTYVAALAGLGQHLQAGTVLTRQQAAALQELAEAAAAGRGFTADQARALEELNEKVKQGLPLTQQEIDALARLADEYALAHREALGLGTAVEQMARQQAAAHQQIQSVAQGFAVFHAELRTGAAITPLHREALEELITAARGLEGVTKADKQALDALGESIRNSKVYTAEQVAEYDRLHAAINSVAGITREEVSGIQEVIAARRAQTAETQVYAEVLTALSEQIQAGEVLTSSQARAVGELSEAAKTNTTFTREQATLLQQVNDKIQQGLPLTEQEVKALREMAAAYREVAQSANQASASKSTFAGLRVEILAMVAAVAALAAGTVAYVRGAVDLSARVETLGVVMGVAAKNAHLSNFELRTQVESVKRLGITTVEATEAVLQFVQAELELDKSAKLARVAQDLAVVAGINSSQAFDRLLRAINTQQPELLRTFGIVTGVQQAMRKYAMETNQTVRELTPLERKQAILNLVLAEGEKVAGAYEQSMETAGKQVGSMARLTEELQKKFGDALLPAFTAIVGIVFKFLELLNTAPPSFFAVMAAVTTTTAALVLMHTVIALKLIPAVAALGAALMAHPIIAGFAVALGAAVYILTRYYQSTQNTIEAEVQAAAAAQTRITRIEELQKRLETAQEASNAHTISIQQLDAAYLALSREVPGAVERIGDAWVTNTEKLQEAIAAERQLMADRLQNAQQQLNQIERDREATLRQMSEIAEMQRRIRRQMQEMQQESGASFNPRAVEGLEQVLEGLSDQYIGLQEDVRGFDAELGRHSGTVTGAARALDPVLNKLETFREAQGALNQLQEDYKDKLPEVTREVEKLGISLTIMQIGSKGFAAASAAQFAQLLENIKKARQALEEQAAKDAKAREQAEQAYKTTLENIRGTAGRTIATLQAANKAFGEVSVGTDEYTARLERGSAAIAQFNRLTEKQQKLYPDLAEAARRLEKVELSKMFREWATEAQNAGRAFAEFTRDSLERLRDEAKQTAASQSFNLERERLATIERVRKMEEEATDEFILDRMNATERAIFLERRRVTDLERSLRQERQAREVAFMEEEYQIRVRFELLRREADRRMETMREEMRLRAAAVDFELEAQVTTGKLTRTQAEARRAEFRGVQALMDADLRYQQQQYRQRLDDEEKFQNALLTQKRVAAKQADDLVDAGMAKARAASQENIRKILEQADKVRTLVKELFAEILTSWASGLSRMLTGMQSWKEGVLGILRSIRDTFFNLVDSMVKKWVEEFIKRKFITGTANLAAGAVGNLMGGSAAGGTLASFGMTAAGSTLASYGPSAGILAAGTGVGAAKEPLFSQASLVKFFQSGAGHATLAGAGSFAAGYLVGGQFDTRKKGALAGAGAGAATGATIGTFVFPGLGTAIGAGIGAIAGAIGGLISGGKEAREVKKFRDELIQTKGGIEALRAEAKRAGFDISKMLDTKKMDEFKREAMKLDIVLKFGSLDELRKRAQLVGVSIDSIFKIKDAERFNKEMERLNGLLAEQQRRLEGWNTVGQGLQTRTTGFLQGIERDVQRIYAGMGPQARTVLETAFKRAVEKGFSGTNLQYLVKVLKDVTEGAPNILNLPPRAVAEFKEFLKGAQESFVRIGTYAAATFAGVLKETGDLNAAMAAVGPTLDMLAEAQNQFGFQTGETLGKLLEFRKVVKVNEDVATSLSGIQQILKGLRDASALTQELFSTLGADVSSQVDTLLRRGVDPTQAMLMAQPALQQLYETQKNTGFVLDANTQRLLDQAKAQGLVGDQFQSVQQKMLDVLIAIARALEADLPAAFDSFGDAADRAGERGYYAMTGVAEGYSPGGVRGIITRLGEAEEAVSSFGQHTVAEMGALRQPLDETAAAMSFMPVVQPVVDTSALGDLAAIEQAAQITGSVALSTDVAQAEMANLWTSIEVEKAAFDSMLGGLSPEPILRLGGPLRDVAELGAAFGHNLIDSSLQLQDHLAALEQGRAIQIDLTDVAALHDLLGALPPDAVVRIEAETGGALGSISLVHDAVLAVPDVVLNAETRDVFTSVEDLRQRWFQDGGLRTLPIEVSPEVGDAYVELDRLGQAAQITGSVEVPTRSWQDTIRQVTSQARGAGSLIGGLFRGFSPGPISAIGAAFTSAQRPAEIFGITLGRMPEQIQAVAAEADGLTVSLDPQPALDAASLVHETLAGLPDAQVVVQALADTDQLQMLDAQLAALAAGQAVPVDLADVGALQRLLAALPSDVYVRIDASTEGALGSLSLVHEAVATLPDVQLAVDAEEVWRDVERLQQALPLDVPPILVEADTEGVLAQFDAVQQAAAFVVVADTGDALQQLTTVQQAATITGDVQLPTRTWQDDIRQLSAEADSANTVISEIFDGLSTAPVTAAETALTGVSRLAEVFGLQIQGVPSQVEEVIAQVEQMPVAVRVDLTDVQALQDYVANFPLEIPAPVLPDVPALVVPPPVLPDVPTLVVPPPVLPVVPPLVVPDIQPPVIPIPVPPVLPQLTLPSIEVPPITVPPLVLPEIPDVPALTLPLHLQDVPPITLPEIPTLTVPVQPPVVPPLTLPVVPALTVPVTLPEMPPLVIPPPVLPEVPPLALEPVTVPPITLPEIPTVVMPTPMWPDFPALVVPPPVLPEVPPLQVPPLLLPEMPVLSAPLVLPPVVPLPLLPEIPVLPAPQFETPVVPPPVLPVLPVLPAPVIEAPVVPPLPPIPLPEIPTLPEWHVPPIPAPVIGAPVLPEVPEWHVPPPVLPEVPVLAVPPIPVPVIPTPSLPPLPEWQIPVPVLPEMPSVAPIPVDISLGGAPEALSALTVLQQDAQMAYDQLTLLGTALPESLPVTVVADTAPALDAMAALTASAPVIPVPLVADPLAPIESSVNRLDTAFREQLPSAMQAFSDAAVQHGAVAEASMTAVALGSSPGGVREIITQTYGAMDALAQYREQVARDSTAVNRDVLGIAQQFSAIPVPPTGELPVGGYGVTGMGIDPLGNADWLRWMQENTLPPPPAPETFLPQDIAPTWVPVEGQPVDVGPQIVIQQGDVNVNINASAWDGYTANQAWQTQIRPQMMDDLQFNREQAASSIEAILSRYRRS